MIQCFCDFVRWCLHHDRPAVVTGPAIMVLWACGIGYVGLAVHAFVEGDWIITAAMLFVVPLLWLIRAYAKRER